MTAQVPDLLFHASIEYCLLDTTAGPPFDPIAHGFNPVSISTACHRGHVCEYAIEGGRLLLRALAISHADPKDTRRDAPLLPLPMLHGVAATVDTYLRDDIAGRLHAAGYGDCQGRYDGIALELPYDGTLLIGSDPCDDGPRFHGHIQAWEMRHLLMIALSGGRVQSTTDVSAAYATVRERYCIEDAMYGDARRNARRFLRRRIGTSVSL